MISVADIIVAVDENVDATMCGGMANCDDNKQCVTHDLWTGLNQILYKYMAEFNLQQLIDNQAKNDDLEVPASLIHAKSNVNPELASV